MKAFTLRHTALTLALALAHAHGAWAGTETLAITGQSAAGAGTGGAFSSFTTPVLNDAGQTAYSATITGGTSTGGVYRNSSGGKPTPIALQGQGAKGAGAGTFSGFSSLVLNEAGQTAFRAQITGGTSTSGIYRSSSSNALTAIALEGQSATGAGAATFFSFGAPVMNDAGQVAFAASNVTAGRITSAVYRSSSGSALTAVAVDGQAAPGAGTGVFSNVETPVLNEAGQTAFLSGVAGGGTNIQAIYRSSSASALTAIALEGQSAPGSGSGTFSFLTDPVLNDSGQTAFRAEINGTSTAALYRSSGGSALTTIAIQGQGATGTGAGTFSSFGSPVLNQPGQIAFLASINGGTSTSGIFRSSTGSVLTAIALQGQSAAGAAAGTFSQFSSPLMNDAGLTAFRASITGGTSTEGLYLGDGRETVAVQLQGAALAGRTVLTLNMGPAGLNRHGQVAYRASFTDGTQGNFLFTPELHWRSTASGNWADAANWTLGLNPAEMHDVTLDPTQSISIVGPSGLVAVKSLQVGTGTGLVTLQMAGGAIDSADPIVIGSRGVLSGTGSFSRLVVNQGTVQADRLAMSASLSNAGLLRGVAGGPRTGAGLDADLLNQASGRVLVQPGETLQLRGASHRNLGVFEINQGRLEVAGSLLNASGGVIDLNRATVLADGAWTNAAGARILLGDARLTVSGGLTNAGQVLVTSGDSDVFGAIVNQKAGQILLSGLGTTTFYDAVELQAGSELRTSAGATAVFFGAVAQRSGALLTGTGHKYFEGAFSVGNSPGLGEDAGNVSFGLGSTYLAEIGGTVLGTGYDHYRVAGTLTLGGTLQLVSFAGFTGEAGQQFDLFDWGTLQGQFSSIDSSGLQLAAGTTLDVSRLYTDGVISVTAVPEPGSWALMAAGLLGMAAWRGRRRQD